MPTAPAARRSRPNERQAGRAAHWIGDITVTADSVSTPSGRSSTEQVEWQIGDAITPAQWAGTSGGAGGVVGTVRVTASARGWTHVTAVRVTTLDDVTAIYAKVLRARRLARRR